MKKFSTFLLTEGFKLTDKTLKNLVIYRPESHIPLLDSGQLPKEMYNAITAINLADVKHGYLGSNRYKLPHHKILLHIKNKHYDKLDDMHKRLLDDHISKRGNNPEHLNPLVNPVNLDEGFKLTDKTMTLIARKHAGARGDDSIINSLLNQEKLPWKAADAIVDFGYESQLHELINKHHHSLSSKSIDKIRRYGSKESNMLLNKKLSLKEGVRNLKPLTRHRILNSGYNEVYTHLLNNHHNELNGDDIESMIYHLSRKIIDSSNDQTFSDCVTLLNKVIDEHGHKLTPKQNSFARSYLRGAYQFNLCDKLFDKKQSLKEGFKLTDKTVLAIAARGDEAAHSKLIDEHPLDSQSAKYLFNMYVNKLRWGTNKEYSKTLAKLIDKYHKDIDTANLVSLHLIGAKKHLKKLMKFKGEQYNSKGMNEWADTANDIHELE